MDGDGPSPAEAFPSMTSSFFRLPPARALLASLAAAVAAAACATSPEALEANDPFEPVNREIYEFNIAADRALLRPAARGYRAVTPQPARDGVHNFFVNLNQPVVFANLVLQGRFEESLETVGRFAMNTVFGLGGVFDVASAEDVPRHETDFGLTLARWGVGEGPYLMLPLLGPSNPRDGIGRIADRYPYPLNWNADFSDSVEAWSLRGLNAVEFRARHGDAFESFERTAIDPYVQFRSAYRQSRRSGLRRMQLENNGEDEDFEDLPDFD
jgi:phospholipid-binding lipoprotein MlaA